MSEIESAWKEYLKTVPMVDLRTRDKPSFTAGFIAGQRSQLPEVKPEELKEDQKYLCLCEDGEWTYGNCEIEEYRPPDGPIREAFLLVTGYELPFQASRFTKFIGPLPMPGQKTMRTKHISECDPDFRRDPKTKHFCWRCQKDLKLGQPYRLTCFIERGEMILHAGDVPAYAGCKELLPVGLDCAKKIGLEWTLPMPEGR